MWKATLLSLKQINNLLPVNELLHQQIRTTYVLKRRIQPHLHKKGGPRKALKSKHYIYEVVKDTSLERQPDLEVVLTTLVEGLGNVGDKVSVRPNYAYNELLLPGLAVYSNPENEAKYKRIGETSEVKKFSSPTAAAAVRSFSHITLSVVMNKDVPWTIKPWHIKASFRKCGYVVPEYAIELPEKPITGPNMDLENKEFAVTITINKQERVNIRCRIHHWSTELSERLPYVEKFWRIPTEPVFAEQKEVLEAIPPKKERIKQQQ